LELIWIILTHARRPPALIRRFYQPNLAAHSACASSFGISLAEVVQGSLPSNNQYYTPWSVNG
jgi:hypothetical protein